MPCEYRPNIGDVLKDAYRYQGVGRQPDSAILNDMLEIEGWLLWWV